ncbi:MAG TPA: signal peptidase I [Firmicutes bacterium]|nr:signal peptidase I [Bacillota bacterium]
MAVKATKSVLQEYVEAIVMAVVLAAFIMTFIARSFSVEGHSMEPTLHNGERLLVDELTYRFRDPARGEIVVLRFPADPRMRFIKRVIGVPGDTILLQNGRVYLNGRPLEEGYIAEPVAGDFGPYVVPPGSYFVLGDNRNHSEDSRFQAVGYVPKRLIVGRAILRYWPPTRIGIVRRPAPWDTAQP